ncbi:hypothetical protein ACFSTC_39020 [Nonomuraea ferruginea]
MGPGSSQSFGFSATATGTNPVPAQFKLNDIVCTKVPA